MPLPALTEGELLDLALTPREDQRGARVVHHRVLHRADRPEGDELLVLAVAVEVPRSRGGTMGNTRICVASRHVGANGTERLVRIALNRREDALAVHRALGEALGLPADPSPRVR